MEFDDYWIFNNLKIFKVHKISYPPIHMVYDKETEEYKSLNAREIYTLLRNSDINNEIFNSNKYNELLENFGDYRSDYIYFECKNINFRLKKDYYLTVNLDCVIDNKYEVEQDDNDNRTYTFLSKEEINSIFKEYNIDIFEFK